jgi:hypothetical protein
VKFSYFNSGGIVSFLGKWDSVTTETTRTVFGLLTTADYEQGVHLVSQI